MDETASNRLVSAIAVAVLIITALFIFNSGQVSMETTSTRIGWISASTGGGMEASLSHLNCTYEISHDAITNSTTIRGVIEEVFNAFRESTTLTYSMGVHVVASWNECSVDVNKKSTLTSELPITVYESSDHYPPAHFAFGEDRMQGNYSFNNTSPLQYVFTIEWNMSLIFTNMSSLDARYMYNISFYVATPALVQVNIPSSLQYNALIVAAVGVVVISLVVRAWNSPNLLNDSET